jgi:ribosomal-protein-alanine N-acetyltransferase
MDQPSLQTARLLLRPYSLSDIADLVRLAGAREVAATTLRIPHPYREQDAVDFIASCKADSDLGSCACFAITLREGGELCGGVGRFARLAPHLCFTFRRQRCVRPSPAEDRHAP